MINVYLGIFNFNKKFIYLMNLKKSEGFLSTIIILKLLCFYRKCLK